jgi:hypothetical protein
MKLAFIDLDRIVIDCTLRFDRAAAARKKFLADAYKAPTITIDGVPQKIEKTYDDKLPAWLYKKADEEYWKVAFTPDLTDLDTPIPGAAEAIDQIEEKNYRAVYLTSRPESLRPATEAWLEKHQLRVASKVFRTALGDSFLRELVLKAPGFQFVKTVIWKVGMVQQISKLFEASNVLVVDDEQPIRDAIIEAQIKNVDVMRYGLLVADSLPEAVKKLGE